MGQKLIITEQDKNSIKHLYHVNEDYVFNVPHITVDGRFLIYKDELYDYSINENLGDVFTIKNLKHIFENINITILKENYNLTEKVKSILNDSTLNESVLKNEVKSSIKNNIILEQSNSMGGIIGRSILLVARKIKSLLWTIGGMAVDAFLVASGIGKSVQWIPWAICFGLDVYEWVSGDYADDESRNASTFWKLLNIGFDVMGMMATGSLAKAAEKLFKPLQGLKSEMEIGKWISKTPKAAGFLEKLKSVLGGVGSKMNELIKYLSTKMPKMASWISSLSSGISKVLGYLGNLTEKFGVKMQSSLINKGGRVGKYLGKTVDGTLSRNVGKGFKSATNTTLGVAGFEKGVELYSGVNKVQAKNMEVYNNLINKKYGGKDPFDL